MVTVLGYGIQMVDDCQVFNGPEIKLPFDFQSGSNLFMAKD
jgi:hypothetical protein